MTVDDDVNGFYDDYKEKYGNCPARKKDITGRPYCSISPISKPRTCKDVERSYCCLVWVRSKNIDRVEKYFGCSYTPRKEK